MLHGIDAGLMQLPEPSQVPPPPDCWFPLHVIGVPAHVVVSDAIAQSPKPLHFPVFPHVVVTAQVMVSRGVPPLAIALQRPVPDAQVLHAEQEPAQQIPSTQMLVPQSPSTPQVCPFAFLHIPLKQAYPVLQPVFVPVHVVAHDVPLQA